VPVDADRISVSGIWWRHVASGIGVFARREPPADGRWQCGRKTEAIYLADSEETAWAEWYRALAEAALPPRAALPRDLFRITVELEEVADLSSSERLERTGLAMPSPQRSSWPSFQQVGEALDKEGARALLAPSAARSGGLVLCVFRHHDEIPGVTVASADERISEPPVPPPGLRT
jgi:RES domain-containing protein